MSRLRGLYERLVADGWDPDGSPDSQADWLQNEVFEDTPAAVVVTAVLNLLPELDEVLEAAEEVEGSWLFTGPKLSRLRGALSRFAEAADREAELRVRLDPEGSGA